MKKNDFLKKLKLGISLFLVMAFMLVNAQAPSKFDRTFRMLYENKEVIKTGKSVKQFPVPITANQTMYSKDKAEVLYNCIIYTTDAAILKQNGILVQSVLPKFVTALVSLNDLEKLANLKQVTQVKYPKTLSVNNEIAVAQSGAALLHAGAFNNTVYKGKGVLVGVFDTGNYWKHPDFKNPTDPTKTRILKMWDQTLVPTGSEVYPTGFNYGVEYTQSQINDELAGVTTGFVRESDTNGHGTHVAGTAAGNGIAMSSKKYTGMAPEADLVIVKGGASEFSTTNIINSLTYFDNVAKSLGKPIVVNMSIGGQFSAHDGTGPEEDAVDYFSNSGPGRVVVIAAGNDNGTNLHTQATIQPGATASIPIKVTTDQPTATDLFGFLLYANKNNDITGTISDTAGNTVSVLAGSSTPSGGSSLGAGFTFYAENNVDNNNNKRYFDTYLARTKGTTLSTIDTWTITIKNNGTTPITIDGWLYYTNDKFDSSNMSITGGDSNYLIGSPGDAKTAITTAAYTGKLNWYSNNTGTPGGYAYTNPSKMVDGLSTFSSYGPLTDGTQKPEIAATGEAIVSALSSGVIATNSSSNVDGVYYQVKSGTSMATPVVAGAVALLLQAKPTATYSEIKNLLISTAQKDAGTTTSLPDYKWGYGKLDVYQALTTLMGNSKKRKTYINETYPYTNASDSGIGLTTQRIAQMYTADINGYLGGFYFSESSTYSGVSSITVEVRNNDGGKPGTTLLGSKSIDVNSFSSGRFSWNYFDLTDLKIQVTSGGSYFIVIYAGGNTPSWSVRRDTTNNNNTSQVSADNGVTWAAATVGYRMRSVVYESTDPILATTNLKINEVSIYPNPTSDILKVKLLKNEKSKIEIYDLSGKLVKQMEANSDHIEINVSTLAKGNYLININTATQKIAKKFIKK